jgi:hypothetical protein
MKSLKEAASATLKLSFDLSLGERVRLKSPIKEIGPERVAKMELKESRKADFRSWAQGP